MANTNKPSGLTPVKYMNGVDWDGRGNVYFLGSGDANALYVGDIVKINATLANSDTTRGLQSITKAAQGDTVVGVVLAIGTQYSGPYVDPTNLTLTSAPATKTQNYYVFVADDPNIVFEIQEAAPSYGTGTAFSAAHTSCNANVVIHAPATGVPVSGTVLDEGTTPAATATFDVRLLGLVQRYDAGALNTYGKYAKWLCKLNLHRYVSTTGVIAT